MLTYPYGVGNTVTRVIEAGEGQPMVLLHGVAARADRWVRNIPGLAAAGYRVFALDLPGHGLATKGRDQAASVAAFADFVRGFMAGKGLTSAVLVGTSLGGHVAATLAVQQPDLVRALVLVGTVGIVPIGPERRERTGMRLRDTSVEAVEAKLRSLIHDDGQFVTDGWLREEHAVNTSPGAAESLEQVGEYFRLNLDDDVVGAELAALAHELRILLIWGAEDVAFPPDMGHACRDRLGGDVPLVLLSSTGHAPYLERPNVFNEVVRQFLVGPEPGHATAVRTV